MLIWSPACYRGEPNGSGDANAIAALELNGDEGIAAWWELMGEVYRCVTGVEEFVTQMRESGTELVPSESMEAFTNQVSSGGMSLVGRLLELVDQLPGLYRVTRRFPDLYWVTGRQADACAGLWPDNWRRPLLDYLNGADAGWRDGTDEVKIAWLDSWITYWSNPVPTATQSVDQWAWVSSTQRDTLIGFFGDSWQEPLRQQLDPLWGTGWDQNPAEYLASWLTVLLTQWMTPPTVAEEQQPVASDKRKREEPDTRRPSNNWRTATRKAKERYAKHGKETDAFSYTSVEAYTRAAMDFWQTNKNNGHAQGIKTVFHDFDPAHPERAGKLVAINANNQLLTFHALSIFTIRHYRSDGDIAAYLENVTEAVE